MKHVKGSIIELIRERTSWRSYRSVEIGPEIEDELKSFMSRLPSPPFGSDARFGLVDAEAPERGEVLGTYGVIRGAGKFIAGAVIKGGRDYEDYGYLMESIILHATSLGLGTCWLGGTFRRSRFAAAMKLGENERMPAVCAVGFRAGKRTVVDRLFRTGAGSAGRKGRDEIFFDGEFDVPLDEGSAGPYDIPLEMVRLAPSASNKQPWRIVADEGTYHFFLTRSRGYDRLIKAADLQRVDMGIAMCHFGLACAELGLRGRWVCENPGLDLPGLTEYVAGWKSVK